MTIVGPNPVASATGKRGKSKKPNWRRPDGVAVIRLELDVSGDPAMRRKVEKHFSAVFALRRALQHDARSSSYAYLSARTDRDIDVKALRARLGLSRKAVETRASGHVEASKWMRHHFTKATALHVADEVWETCDRFLFTDTSGRTAGVPNVGSWWDFHRIPGRAKSHTKTPFVWETYRLVGSLQGHLDVYNRDRLTVAEAACLPVGAAALDQRASIPVPATPRTWRDHDGALTVVYTGLAGGDLVLPVRLPQGSGRFLRLAHFLADPEVWHKIDLVRTRDQSAPGGWRYAAHLTILGVGHTSAATDERRAAVPQGRLAGIDGNVSNVAIASFNDTDTDSDTDGDIRTSYLTPTDDQRAVAAREAKKTRHRTRALDRSRRAANTKQYELSKAQRRRAVRRAAAGLPVVAVDLPKGQRVANKAGVPKQAYVATPTPARTSKRVPCTRRLRRPPQ